MLTDREKHGGIRKEMFLELGASLKLCIKATLSSPQETDHSGAFKGGQRGA